MNINEMIEAIPAHTRTNKFALDAETEQVLDAFVDWLVVNNKTTATARSYRSYCAKALCLGLDWSDMTSDMRSAVRKLAEFQA